MTLTHHNKDNLATLYEVLGVEPKAKPHILRNAYRRLARTHHPDVNPDPRAHELMAKINSAFETLIDPVRRMEYDSVLNGGFVEDPTPDQRESRAPDAVSVQIAYRLRDHKTPIYGLSFAADTGQLISTAFDNELMWWDMTNGQSLRRLKVEGGVISTIRTLPGDKIFVAGNSENVVTSWIIQDGAVTDTRSVPHEWSCCAALSADGQNVAIGSVNRMLNVYRTKSGKELFESSAHADSVTSVAWAPNGKRLATGSADATVKIWDAAAGKEIHTFINVRSTVTSMAFSPDGKYLAVAAVDLSVRIFRLTDMRLVKTFFGHEKPIEALAFHPSGWLLGTVARDGCVGLYDVDRGVGHGKIEASHMPLASIAFSADGKRLAAGGLDKVLRVWDLAVRKPS